MKTIIGKAVNALAVHAALRRDATARVERVLVHALFILVADHWFLVARSAAGIARELKGI